MDKCNFSVKLKDLNMIKIETARIMVVYNRTPTADAGLYYGAYGFLTLIRF